MDKIEFFHFFTTLVGSMLTGWLVHISSKFIEKEKRKLAANNFINLISEELPHDLIIFKKIKTEFDPIYRAKTRVNIELLDSLLLNDSVSNYRDSRCHLNNKELSKKILEYVLAKRSLIYGIKSDLNQLASIELENVNRDHLVSNLNSRINSIPDIVKNAEVILKHFEK